MRIQAASGLAVLLMAATVMAQDPRTRLYTQPTPPPREALDRLNLKMAWTVHVPMGGQQDGLASVQLDGKDLFVQTHSGLVTLIDAETGVTRWRARVGTPYQAAWPMAFNNHHVLVVNGAYLFGLDRASGQVLWQFSLTEGVSAPPVAGEDMVFISTPRGHLIAYFLPHGKDFNPGAISGPLAKGPPLPSTESAPVSPLYKKATRSSGVFGTTGTVRDASRPEVTGAQPVKLWDASTLLRLEFKPLVTDESVLAVSPTGMAIAVAKAPRDNYEAGIQYRFPVEGPIQVAPGQYGNTAYIGSQNANLYALDISGGRLEWRFTAGTGISQQPVATEQDVYVTAERNGMTRLDRATGASLWRIRSGNRILTSNPEADRFLAANPKFVYAFDFSGRLLVLDRDRGTRLSVYDLRTFVFPITNEWTDRLYLAANNGLIVCLHDREYTTPYRHRQLINLATEQLKKQLAQEVTEVGGKEVPLKDYLQDIQRTFKLKIVIASDEFKEGPIQDKKIKPPQMENQPLGKLLQEILSQVNATYTLVEDAVLVVPAKPKEGEENKPPQEKKPPEDKDADK